MRRKDKEIDDRDEMVRILERETVCRLGFAVLNEPYVVPMNYGFHHDVDKDSLYFHMAKEGRKIEMIQQNNRVCFEVDTDHELVRGTLACNYGFCYKSVIGYGRMVEITEMAEKRRALSILMRQFAPNTSFTFDNRAVDSVAVYRLTIEEMTGKKSPAN